MLHCYTLLHCVMTASVYISDGHAPPPLTQPSRLLQRTTSFILHWTALHFTTSSCATSYHTTSHHTTSHYTTSHHTVPHPHNAGPTSPLCAYHAPPVPHCGVHGAQGNKQSPHGDVQQTMPRHGTYVGTARTVYVLMCVISFALLIASNYLNRVVLCSKYTHWQLCTWDPDTRVALMLHRYTSSPPPLFTTSYIHSDTNSNWTKYNSSDSSRIRQIRWEPSGRMSVQVQGRFARLDSLRDLGCGRQGRILRTVQVRQSRLRWTYSTCWLLQYGA